MQKKILDFIFNLSIKRGKLILITTLVITVIMGAFIPQLKISSSQKDLIPRDHPEQAKYIKFSDEFGSSDNLIVVLEGDSYLLKKYADTFAAEISKEKKWVKSLFYKIDASVLIKRAPLYIPLEDLKKGLKLMREKRGMIRRIQNVTSFYGLLDQVTRSFKEPNVDVSVDTAAKIIHFLNSLFVEWDEWMSNDDHIRLRIAEKLSKDGFSELANLQSEGYLFSRDFKMLYIMVQPSSFSDDISYLRPFIADIRKACNRVLDSNKKIKDKIKVSFTGMPAHVLTETEIIYSDVGGAGTASVIIISIILLIGFRSMKKMIIAVVPTAAGLIISLGIITIFIGRLNLISSSFLAVLFGIGIDFGIYLLQRTEEELGNGLDQNEAIYKSVVLTSRSIISGALTTALAFLALSLSKFVGYSELGFSAGVGLLVVMATTFIMIPPFLMLLPVKARDYNLDKTIKSAVTEKRKKMLFSIVGISIVVTAFSIFAATRMEMDYNVMKLLPRNTESTIYQNKMEENSDFKVSFAMVTDKNFKNLKEITKKIEKLPTVSRIDSLVKLIPEEQEKKIRVIHEFKPLLGNFRIKLTKNNHGVNDYKKVLDLMAAYFEEAQEKAFAGNQSELVKSIDKLLASMNKISEKFSSEKGVKALARTKKFEEELFINLERATQIIRESLNPEIISEDTFPPEIIGRFKSSKGTYVAFVSPRGSIWNLDFLDKFVSDIKSVTKDVTGFPITHQVYVRLAVDAVVEAMLYSFGIILILLIIDFRNFRDVVLALVPLFIGMMWLQLALFIFRIDYNVANIAGLPLLLGLGIVYGLRIVHRWREEPDVTAFTATKTTGRGLAFAALAIACGLFSIVFARHNGVSAFGMILLFGIGLCLFTALFILPAIIDLVFLKKDSPEEKK